MSATFRVQLCYVSADTVQVRVQESAGGEPRQALPVPLPGPARSALVKVLESGSLDEQPLGPAELAALRALGAVIDGRLLGPDALHLLVGELLADALLPASADPDHDVRGAFLATWAEAERTGEPARLQLRFDKDAVDLAALPWELLALQGQHPVADGRVQLTRYITLGQTTSPYPVSDRLDVLSIVARPVDAPALDATGEIDAIDAALRDLQDQRTVRIQRLSPPTYDALVAALNAHPFHIVHFDGHGLFGRRCPFCQQYQRAEQPFCTTPGCGARLDETAPQGCLLFERSAEDRRSHLVSASELGEALAGRAVRLLVATACQSATVGGADVFSGVGPRMILAGVPAVVAMQYSLTQAAAVAFSGEFYAALARGDPVAAATSASRRALLSRNAWHIPTLYLRSGDGEGRLFRWRDPRHLQVELLGGAGQTRICLQPAGAAEPDWQGLAPRAAAPFKFLSPYDTKDHARFFGREAETRALLSEVLQRPVVLLQGPSGIGKTSLVNAGLIPALLGHGFLALAVSDDSDPVQALIRTVDQSPALQVSTGPVDDLAGLAALLQREIGHPLLLVFDQVEELLRSASPEQRASFAALVVACASAPSGLPVRVLLVTAEEAAGPLAALDARLPVLWGAPFSLGPLDPGQAEQALQAPLARHDPPMSFDLAWLRSRLLPELGAKERGQAINPTHLQIVGHELYRLAIQGSAQIIGSDLCPPGGAAAILASFLEQSLRRRFDDPATRELARGLLMQMVSQAGAPVALTAAQAAAAVQAPPAQVEDVLQALRADGLLMVDGQARYTLSHHTLTAEVQRWFNREEALTRCAQETLDRAWDDWHAQHLAGRDAAAPELLVGANRLEELQARLEQLRVTAPQRCLLLRSAVRHQANIPFWAHHVAEDAPTRALLSAIEKGQATEEPVAEDLALAGAALSLEQLKTQALAEAAVSHPAGHVRHTAALALAATGLDQVNRSLPRLGEAAPAGRGWRRAQALAQMRAAGFPLPQIKPALALLVAVWSLGLAVWRQRWPLLLESLAAGLGASVGLGAALLVNVLASPSGLWPLFVLRSVLFMPIGYAIGTVTVAVAWVVVLAGSGGSSRSRAVRQIIGVWLGFVLGLLLLWWPLDAFSTLAVELSQLGSGLPRDRDIIGTYVVGGSLWALGIALGQQLLAGRGTSLIRALLGAGIGGAIGCLAAWLLGFGVPLAEPAGRLALVQVALAGFGLGGGLAAGRVTGARIWAAMRHEHRTTGMTRQGLSAQAGGGSDG